MPLFFRRAATYKGLMSKFFGWGARIGAMMNENRGGPWGSGGGGSGGGSGGGGGPRNPWGQPPRSPRPIGGGNVTSLDEFLKKSRARFGGGFPGQSGRPYWLYGLGIAVVLWLLFTSVHRIGPQEAGVVTRLGSYAGTMGSGIGFSLPSPIDRVQKVDVQEIRTIDIGSTDSSSENLILTGDPEYHRPRLFRPLDDPAIPSNICSRSRNPRRPSASRRKARCAPSVAGVSLDEAIGAGRARSSSASSR
jgi:membrane protease subunit HflK